MTDFSEDLRTARNAVGLTQAELASALSVEQATVSRWERGAEPSLDNVIMLLRFFGEHGASIPYLDRLLKEFERGGGVSVGGRPHIPVSGFIHDIGFVEAIPEPEQEIRPAPADATAFTACLLVKTNQHFPYLPPLSAVFYEGLNSPVQNLEALGPGTLVIARSDNGNLLFGELYPKTATTSLLRLNKGGVIDVESSTVRRIWGAVIHPSRVGYAPTHF